MGSGAASYHGVFFDFDYTLVDSGDAIAACFGEALSRNGDAPVAAEIIKPMIGLPLKQMYHRVVRQAADDPGRRKRTGSSDADGPGDVRSARLIHHPSYCGPVRPASAAFRSVAHPHRTDEYASGALGRETPQPLGLTAPRDGRVVNKAGSDLFPACEPIFEARYDAFLAYYAAAADRQMVAGSRLYPGVENLLRACRDNGCRTAIVTNKASSRVDQFLEAHRFGDLVELVVGSDTVSRPKPHPMGLERALTSFGLQAARALYVGDSLLDMHAAHMAGMPFAAVCTGHHCAADFNPERTAHIACDLAGLAPTIVAAIAASLPTSLEDSNAATVPSSAVMHSASGGRLR